MNAQELFAETWRQLARRQGATGQQTELVLDELIAAYLQPSRQYHTLEHIAQLLRQFEQHGQAVLDRDAVVLAIIFHDAIYDPQRQDNEQQSAALARARLTWLACDEALLAKVVHYIEATQHALTLDSSDPDLALLLDLDLSTLAAQPQAYSEYAKAIRREYAHVPDAHYRLGRRQILEGFLARDRIYRTDALNALWEARARSNISGEIAGLI